MDCSVCRELKRAYETGLSEYERRVDLPIIESPRKSQPASKSIWNVPGTNWRYTNLSAIRPSRLLHLSGTRPLSEFEGE